MCNNVFFRRKVHNKAVRVQKLEQKADTTYKIQTYIFKAFTVHLTRNLKQIKYTKYNIHLQSLYVESYPKFKTPNSIEDVIQKTEKCDQSIRKEFNNILVKV